jgi:hypothetical protein
MSLERTFGMLKGKFKILPKILKIPSWLTHVYTTCALLVQMALTWTRLWRLKNMHKLKQIQHLGT